MNNALRRDGEYVVLLCTAYCIRYTGDKRPWRVVFPRKAHLRPLDSDAPIFRPLVGARAPFLGSEGSRETEKPFVVTDRGKLRIVCTSSSGTCEPAKSNVESDTEAAAPERERVCPPARSLSWEVLIPYTAENSPGLARLRR